MKREMGEPITLATMAVAIGSEILMGFIINIVVYLLSSFVDKDVTTGNSQVDGGIQSLNLFKDKKLLYSLIYLFLKKNQAALLAADIYKQKELAITLNQLITIAKGV